MGFIDGLKKKWNLKSGRQALIILFVFACTGISALFAKNAFYYVMEIDPQTLSAWTKVSISLVSLIFVYPILLLFYGFLFGQFAFFWNFKKRMYQRIGRLFHKKKASTP